MPSPHKIVDSHQHACWEQRNTRGLVADLDAHGIAYAWLLSWCMGPAEDSPLFHHYLDPARHGGSDTQSGIPLATLIAAQEQFPTRFVIGFCPNPAWREAPRLLEAAHHMHGARICGEWKYRQLLDDPRSLEIFRTAGRLRMPVVLHLDTAFLRNAAGEWEYRPLWFGGTAANLERVLQACPETHFIGHAPAFWREISGDADDSGKLYPDGPVTSGGRLYRLFDQYPNLSADLSAGSGRAALQRDPKHAADFIERYADRLLFGRDCYEQELHAFLQTLSLSAKAVEKIYWRNADNLVAPPAG